MSAQGPVFDRAGSKLSNVAVPVEKVVGTGFDAKRFVKNLEVLAEAEGSAGRLRQLVFDLAMRGFLVAQSLGSTSDLVLRLAEQAGYPLDCADPPFNLPPGWSWSRLGAVSSEVRYGYTAPAQTERKGVRLLRITDIQNDHVEWDDVPGCAIDEDKVSGFELHEGDLVIARTGGTIGKTYLVEALKVRAVFASYLIRVAPLPPMSPGYLKVFGGSRLYWRQLYAGSAGTGQPNVNATTLKSLFVPVAPPDEQKRIVAKVDELMHLIDDLEAKQTKKRETQARLRTAALDALTLAEGPEEFEAAWKRVTENFGVLFERAESVGALRSAALDLAVRGLLGTGSPTDTPAAKLLTGLAAERQDVRARSARLSPSAPAEAPFAIPDSWRWERLDRIWRTIADGDHQPPPKEPFGVAFLTIGNVSKGRLDFSQTRFVSRRYFDDLDESRVPKAGDLLYTVVGSFGIPVVVDTNTEFCVQRHIAILRPLPSTNVRWMRYWLRSRFVFRQAQASATGIAQPTVGLGSLRAFLVPVPPAEEQARLVQKLDAIMNRCDDLEAKLRRAEEIAAKLAEAVAAETVGA